MSATPPYAAKDAPVEIWSRIFEEFTQLDYSPWLLALVCRRWHAIVMRTPSLWSSILITNRFFDGRIKPRSDGRYHVCSKISELEEVLGRAKKSYLIVWIQYTIIKSFDPPEADPEPAVITRLFREDTIKRIGELDLDTNCNIILGQLTISPTMVLSSLHTLILGHNAMRSPEALGLVSQTTHRLERIEFPVAKIPEPWINSGVLNRFKTLSCPWFQGDNNLDQVLPLCTSLTKLCTKPQDWPLDNTPHIIFKHLHHLEVYCRWPGLLSRLGLLELVHLVMLNYRIDWANLEELQGFSESPVNLPELESLTIETVTPYWLLAFNMPKLIHLSINTDGVNCVPKVNFLLPESKGRIFASVHTLFLDTTSFGRDINLLFEIVPNAQMVTIGVKSRSGAGLETTLQYLADCEGDRGNVPIPGLKNLVLGNKENPLRSRKSGIADRVKQLLRSRRAKQFPLESVEVYWSNSETEKEPVVQLFQQML